MALPSGLESRGPARADGCNSKSPWSVWPKVAQDEGDVGRPFGEPPHEVRIPVRAVRDVHPDGVPGSSQRCLQIRADAEQHLKLEPGRIDRALSCVSAGLLDQRWIVCGQGGIVPLLKQSEHQPLVTCIDLRLTCEGDRERL